MRVAVVDLGSNSTRLLVADVEGSRLTELLRLSTVTRLGEGVDRNARLSEAAQARVHTVLDRYDEQIDRLAPDARLAIMTSAVRDARDGEAFAASVRERHGLDGRILDGGAEARLTFRGATATRPATADAPPLLVVDVGGGSTELVVGRGAEVLFHVSTQVGVVRHSERHIVRDPPTAAELEALAADARRELHEALPATVRRSVVRAVGVAGTPISCSAIAQSLERPTSAQIEGSRLTLAQLDAQLARLAALPLEDRRHVTGLHPDRAPTVLPGIVILAEVLRAFGLDELEVSDRDVLWGAALEWAAGR